MQGKLLQHATNILEKGKTINSRFADVSKNIGFIVSLCLCQVAMETKLTKEELSERATKVNKVIDEQSATLDYLKSELNEIKKEFQAYTNEAK